MTPSPVGCSEEWEFEQLTVDKFRSVAFILDICCSAAFAGIDRIRAAGAGPHYMDYLRARWPKSPRIAVKCDP